MEPKDKAGPLDPGGGAPGHGQHRPPDPAVADAEHFRRQGADGAAEAAVDDRGQPGKGGPRPGDRSGALHPQGPDAALGPRVAAGPDPGRFVRWSDAEEVSI